ncbi:putative deoxyribonuclease TATDN1 [Sitophilus oryzae]|uniref:Deoxyribonuclease TATDN1 n=1 Tax=Sitophilus oryzae TaxID=7048 RepID=A0A6J2XR65_SITOR|nr:putative deoxyribonuclease TATDN1 [Sitophilus oryzae]
MTWRKRFIDIGANLTDPMYQGIYNGSKKHEPDLNHVLKRSWDSGLEKIIITGGSLEESEKAIQMSKTDDKLYATVGCHPTRCYEFESNNQDPIKYLESLGNLVKENRSKVVALGECGLDYDRLQFCDKDTQKKYFNRQLQLNETFKLPLFLHCRNAASDVFAILSSHDFTGVVHSFDGTLDEAIKFITLGYYIGINGCSLKSEENLQTIKDIPSEKILIETDCPWCEIRPTHAGYKYISEENKSIPSVKKEKWKQDHMVKSRNEPTNIGQVLDVIAAVKNEPVPELGRQIHENTLKLFFKQ